MRLRGYILLQMSPVINHRVRNIPQNAGDIILLAITEVTLQLFIKPDLKRRKGVVNLQQRGKLVVGKGHQLLELNSSGNNVGIYRR